MYIFGVFVGLDAIAKALAALIDIIRETAGK